MFKCKKYFSAIIFPLLIVSFLNAVVEASDKKASKMPSAKKSGTNECELIASFNDLIKQSWPEFIDAGTGVNSLRMNVEESPENFHIEAEMPGVKKEDVTITLKGNNLVIAGEKKSFSEEKKNQYRRVERTSGSFYRSIALPGNIDKEKITSKLEDGILKVDVMKLKNSQAAPDKKIDIL